MEKILVKNKLDFKIGQYFFKLNGYNWVSNDDSVSLSNDEFPVVLAKASENTLGYYSNIANHPDALSIQTYLKKYKIVITDVLTEILPHVKEVAKYLDGSVNKKNNVITFNKNSETEITLNVNEFLDIFDDNLLFKKKKTAIRSGTDLDILKAIGDSFDEIDISDYKFDKETWKWVNLGRPSAEFNRDLLQVRNLDLLILNDNYSYIDSNNLRDKIISDTSLHYSFSSSSYPILELNDHTFVYTPHTTKKVVNTILLKSYHKIIKKFFFEFGEDVYKSISENDDETTTGESKKGEIIVVKNSEIKIVKNRKLKDSDYNVYLLFKKLLVEYNSISFHDDFFSYEGESYYYGESNLMILTYNSYHDSSKKLYTSLVHNKSESLCYCHNDFNVIPTPENLIENSFIKGEFIDIISGKTYIKTGGGDCLDENLEECYPNGIILPTFEKIKPFHSNPIEHEMKMFDDFAKSGRTNDNNSVRNILRKIQIRLHETKTLEIPFDKFKNNLLNDYVLDKYLTIYKSKLEINSRSIKIELEVFNKVFVKEFDIISYSDNYIKCIEKC